MSKTVRLVDTCSKYNGSPIFIVVNDWRRKFSVHHVYTDSTQIDGHWLTRASDASSVENYDPIHDQVIGITSDKERIPIKTYESALSFAEQMASRFGERFINESTFSGRHPERRRTLEPGWKELFPSATIDPNSTLLSIPYGGK